MTGDARGHHGEEYERLLCQERLILDVTEQLAGTLEDGGVTRAELARRLGRTPGFVSQVLSGGRNLTLRTIADIAAALSLRPSFKLSCNRKTVPEWTNETNYNDNWRRKMTQEMTQVAPLFSAPVQTNTDATRAAA